MPTKLPLNLDDLRRQRTVGGTRIEYKELVIVRFPAGRAVRGIR